MSMRAWLLLAVLGASLLYVLASGVLDLAGSATTERLEARKIAADSSATASPSAAASPTPSPSPSPTASPTSTATPTPSPSATRTRTHTPSPSATATSSATASPSVSASSTPTATVGSTTTSSPTSTSTPTSTLTPTFTSTPTATVTSSATASMTASPAFTPTPFTSDSFAGASTLLVPASGTTISTSGSTEAASVEAGEPATPSCAGGVAIGKTVWYRVVTEATGVVTASTAGSTFDTVLAIYTGSSLASLHEIACNDDVSGDDTTSEVLFGAVAGETYFLQLGGFDAAAGKFELRLWLDTSRTAPPPTATRTPLPTSTIPPTATLTPTAPAATALGAVGPPALAGGVIGPAAGTTQPGVPAGQSLLTRPATVAVSALAPSIVRFVLPAGYELAISFDPAAIAALQAALPSVTQLWIVFDPQPVLLDDRQRGSLGGGNVTPAGHPFYLAIVPKDSAGMTIVPTAPAGSDDPQRRLPSD